MATAMPGRPVFTAKMEKRVECRKRITTGTDNLPQQMWRKSVTDVRSVRRKR